ncbi:esterified fatty acid cis/trans isomerase, partial [Pseudomonas syringae pv. pisi str. 1704B]
VEQQAITPSVTEAAQINAWEAQLNEPGANQALVGRWLFEHLFLAHIYFEGGEAGHFFQWVRSRTPSGKPVDLIATRRPDDDPGSDFYYRLIPVP